MSRIKLILLLTLFVLTVSCNVHTFTFGEGPSEGYSKIIKQNNLKDFDDAKLLPSSKELESLI